MGVSIQGLLRACGKVGIYRPLGLGVVRIRSGGGDPNVFDTAIKLQVSPLRRKRRASGRDDNVVGGAMRLGSYMRASGRPRTKNGRKQVRSRSSE